MINIAVEGDSDVAIAKAVVGHAGHTVGRVVVSSGKSRLDTKIAGYLRASRFQPWVVFRDSDGVCPVVLAHKLLQPIKQDVPAFALRFAVTMSEAWLLADQAGFSDYFGISESRIPHDPDSIPHAKQLMLTLCQKSSNRDIRQDVGGHGTTPGPLYVHRITDFASNLWRVEAASERSSSLRRAIKALEAMSEYTY